MLLKIFRLIYVSCFFTLFFSVRVYAVIDISAIDSCFDFDPEYVVECCQKYSELSDLNNARKFCAEGCELGEPTACLEYAHILTALEASKDTAQKIYHKLCNNSFKAACSFVKNSNSNGPKLEIKPKVKPKIEEVKKVKEVKKIKEEFEVKKTVGKTVKEETRKINEALWGGKSDGKSEKNADGTLIIFLLAILFGGVVLAIFREKRNKKVFSYDHEQAVQELIIKKEQKKMGEDRILRSEFERLKGKVIDLVFNHDINKIKDLNQVPDKDIVLDIEAPPELTLVKNPSNEKMSDSMYDK